MELCYTVHGNFVQIFVHILTARIPFNKIIKLIIFNLKLNLETVFYLHKYGKRGKVCTRVTLNLQLTHPSLDSLELFAEVDCTLYDQLVKNNVCVRSGLPTFHKNVCFLRDNQ